MGRDGRKGERERWEGGEMGGVEQGEGWMVGMEGGEGWEEGWSRGRDGVSGRNGEDGAREGGELTLRIIEWVSFDSDLWFSLSRY